MPQTGDTVRFLNDVGGGRIVRIDGNIAYVDDDGFETPVLLKECVVVRTASDEAMSAAPPVPVTPKAPAQPGKARDSRPERPAAPLPAPGPAAANITLAFAPVRPLEPSQTPFEGIVVNDSGYWLYFVLLTRSDGNNTWQALYHGYVEPDTELTLGEFDRTVTGAMDHLRLQAVAFAPDAAFTPLPPVDVTVKVDTTKFFKPHCYKAHRYFTVPVLAWDVVTGGKAMQPAGSAAPAVAAVPAMPKAVRRKAVNHDDLPPSPQVTDLHIDQLVDTTAGFSPADILNLQVDTFRRVMDANLGRPGHKMIFIHGKGDGVLRQALLKELRHRYAGHDVQDASFAEYGYGATQVVIRANPSKFVPRKSRP